MEVKTVKKEMILGSRWGGKCFSQKRQGYPVQLSKEQDPKKPMALVSNGTQTDVWVRQH